MMAVFKKHPYRNLWLASAVCIAIVASGLAFTLTRPTGEDTPTQNSRVQENVAALERRLSVHLSSFEATNSTRHGNSGQPIDALDVLNKYRSGLLTLNALSDVVILARINEGIALCVPDLASYNFAHWDGNDAYLTYVLPPRGLIRRLVSLCVRNSSQERLREQLWSWLDSSLDLGFRLLSLPWLRVCLDYMWQELPIDDLQLWLLTIKPAGGRYEAEASDTRYAIMPILRHLRHWCTEVQDLFLQGSPEETAAKISTAKENAGLHESKAGIEWLDKWTDEREVRGVVSESLRRIDANARYFTNLNYDAFRTRSAMLAMLRYADMFPSANIPLLETKDDVMACVRSLVRLLAVRTLLLAQNQVSAESENALVVEVSMSDGRTMPRVHLEVAEGEGQAPRKLGYIDWR
ncbi:MAG: hypothetical protein IPK87_00070 [Planctomycetes bacterium]|nr:hypothetical protein [Planctomycetota bacterium]